MMKRNVGILTGWGLVAVIATSLVLGFGFQPAKEFVYIDEATKLLERHFELEQMGAWEEWVDNLIIRSYPEIGYPYDHNDRLASIGHLPKSALADYEILNVEYLETWSTRPVRPWIGSKAARHDVALYEKYHGVVRFEVWILDTGPHGGQNSYVVNFHVVRDEQGELKIHWSPWFAYNG